MKMSNNDKYEVKVLEKRIARERDPFAASLLPKIQQMLKEAKSQVQQELDLLQTRI